jgi:hypothetical protein
MVWEFRELQVSRLDIAGKGDKDAFTKKATMILENAVIENIDVGGYAVYENGVLTDSRELRPATSAEYEHILGELSAGYVFGVGIVPNEEEGRQKIIVMAGYEITVTFTKSIIEWNEFGEDKHYGTQPEQGTP